MMDGRIAEGDVRTQIPKRRIKNALYDPYVKAILMGIRTGLVMRVLSHSSQTTDFLKA